MVLKTVIRCYSPEGINVYNIFTGSDVQLKQAPSIDLSKIGHKHFTQAPNPFSTVFAP
jgi:hypothetical protein